MLGLPREAVKSSSLEGLKIRVDLGTQFSGGLGSTGSMTLEVFSNLNNSAFRVYTMIFFPWEREVRAAPAGFAASQKAPSSAARGPG